jgi:hypothetical protein
MTAAKPSTKPSTLPDSTPGGVRANDARNDMARTSHIRPSHACARDEPGRGSPRTGRRPFERSSRWNPTGIQAPTAAWSAWSWAAPAGCQQRHPLSTTAIEGRRRSGPMARPSGTKFTQGGRMTPEGADHRLREEWCPGRDLNPDELPHTPLKRTRIPIPPPGQGAHLRPGSMDPEGYEVVVPRTGLEPIRPCGH